MASGRRNSTRSSASGTETAAWCSSRRSGLSELLSSSVSNKGSSMLSFVTTMVKPNERMRHEGHEGGTHHPDCV